MMDELSTFTKKDLLKVLAMLTLSDGHLYIHKGRPRTVRLVTSEYGKAQHSFFNLLCTKLFDRKIVTRIKKLENGKKIIISDLNYHKGVSELLLLSPTYKTTPGTQTKLEYLSSPQPTISFLLKSSEKVRWFCLRTYFDFDGSISPSIKLKSKKDRKKGKTYQYYQVQTEIEIKISETNPSLVRELVLLCESLGLKARITKDKRNWIDISGICISEKKSVKKFLEQGGSITNVLISGKSKNFENISKKELSFKLLNLFDDQEFSFSNSFSTVEEAEGFRKSIKNKIYFQPTTHWSPTHET
jgi:hypothetical protein